MLNKVLLSVAIPLGAALAVGTPALADPGSFGTLGCRCDTSNDVRQGATAVEDQIKLGIRNGLRYPLSSLPGIEGPRG